jgi:small nuclear ribonucleoprotein (snRNP)-like protein
MSAVTGAVLKTAEGGTKRVEVAKKRHISQLFVRGDNVVLVAEYHHEN